MVEVVVGWDLALAVMPEVLADMGFSIGVVNLIMETVEGGELGAKTGQGFYDCVGVQR